LALPLAAQKHMKAQGSRLYASLASSLAWEDEIISKGKSHNIRHTLSLME